ncbi:YegP family protein [Flavobacterium sp.]|uniref:YegP family protein n=1 Tax=Flavobacterium sp. TaxID=239 RepID=UPI003D6BFE9C
MGKYVISKRENGEFQFDLKDENGKTILASDGYSVKYSCLNGIESAQSNSQIDSRYDKKTSLSGRYFFNLKASNGQIIGRSEMYENESRRDNGIEIVKNNGISTIIDI